MIGFLLGELDGALVDNSTGDPVVLFSIVGLMLGELFVVASEELEGGVVEFSALPTMSFLFSSCTTSVALFAVMFAAAGNIISVSLIIFPAQDVMIFITIQKTASLAAVTMVLRLL